MLMLTYTHSHSLTLTLTLTHTHTHTHSHSHSHSLILTLTHTHSHSLILIHSHTHTHTHSHSYSYTHTHTHTHSHSYTLILTLTLTHTQDVKSYPVQWMKVVEKLDEGAFHRKHMFQVVIIPSGTVLPPDTPSQVTLYLQAAVSHCNTLCTYTYTVKSLFQLTTFTYSINVHCNRLICTHSYYSHAVAHTHTHRM